MVRKIAGAASGVCLGYAFVQVFLSLFVGQIVLGTFRIQLPFLLGTNVRALELLNFLALGIVAHQVFGVDQKMFQQSAYAGAGLWALVVIYLNLG